MAAAFSIKFKCRLSKNWVSQQSAEKIITWQPSDSGRKKPSNTDDLTQRSPKSQHRIVAPIAILHNSEGQASTCYTISDSDISSLVIWISWFPAKAQLTNWFRTNTHQWLSDTPLRTKDRRSDTFMSNLAKTWGWEGFLSCTWMRRDSNKPSCSFSTFSGSNKLGRAESNARLV